MNPKIENKLFFNWGDLGHPGDECGRLFTTLFLRKSVGIDVGGLRK